ncbi:MAG: phosphatidylglycerophosphatase A, partial [Candidatus Omnitrophica bacterium]|nr:phosphatidylglycerophosphatase A [Candidatus Omnitrophota bacterium]
RANQSRIPRQTHPRHPIRIPRRKKIPPQEKKNRKKDPSYIIIDEFVNIFPVFLFVPITFFTVIMGFILYRFFDVTKIYPIKELEKVKSGWGIMLDDFLSAVYANIVLHLILFFCSI